MDRATEIRGKVITALSTLKYGSVSIPVFDEVVNPNISLPSVDGSIATYVVIQDQQEQLKVSANIEQAQMQLPTVYRVGVMFREGFMPSVQHVVKWREKNFRIINAPVVENVRYGKELVFDITAKD